VWRFVKQFVQTWEESALLDIRLGWVRSMTPLFALATVVCLVERLWPGVAIAGLGVVVGAFQWRRLRRLRRSNDAPDYSQWLAPVFRNDAREAGAPLRNQIIVTSLIRVQP
jgi:hypothetical protein